MSVSEESYLRVRIHRDSGKTYVEGGDEDNLVDEFVTESVDVDGIKITDLDGEFELVASWGTLKVDVGQRGISITTD